MLSAKFFETLYLLRSLEKSIKASYSPIPLNAPDSDTGADSYYIESITLLLTVNNFYAATAAITCSSINLFRKWKDWNLRTLPDFWQRNTSIFILKLKVR